MKTFKHFLLFAFALVLSVGCTDPEPEAEPATLEVNPTSLTFATEGGSQEITVTSNTYWSVTSTESWLTISATSGNGDQVITVTASANEGEDIRSAVLKFSAEEVSPIEVTAQQSSQTVELPNLVTTLEASYSLEYKAETVEFEITSNVAWILSSDAEWLTVSPEEGVNDGTASFSVALNDSTELRTATLTISGADLEPIEVTIEQGAANLSSTLTSNYEFGNEGGEQSFEIISNVAWTITSDSEWLTVSPLEGENSITASFTVASYDGSEDRVGTFTIASELTEDITIEVTQTAAPFDDSKAITFADECLEMALFDAGVDTDEDGWISYAEAAAVATLTTLNGQMISSFDEIVYFTSLTVLRIDDNDLTSINLSMCPSLQTLNIASNKLSELNLSNNPLIGAVWCNDNSLTELNLENAAELTQLWCGNNKISSLDFSHSPSMLYLDCSNNSISELEIPEMLSTLDASKNSLSKVDISERYLLSKVSLTGQSTGNCELTVNAVQSFIYSSFAADDVTLNVLQGPIAVEVAESLSTSFSLNTTMGDYSGNYAVGLMASADLVNLTTYSPSVLAASLYTTMGAMGVDFTKVDSEFVFNSNLSGVATPEAWGLTESTEYVICAMPLTSAGDVDDSELPTIIFSSTGIQDDPAGEYNPAYNSTAVVTTSMTSASVELTIPDGVSKVYY
ncbi:MAG: BACON domain-containing carbohydrate-binding protein, partial [Rikenellaceae bacterium]